MSQSTFLLKQFMDDFGESVYPYEMHNLFGSRWFFITEENLFDKHNINIVLPVKKIA